MGASQSGRGVERSTKDEEVNFDHFQILRAIGKGSFGKVCIVQKKDCKRMFAMKYMNKSQCMERDALRNVLREVEILTTLEHPFLVNLWFSFQDEEDLFMVSDLLLGGDLRYHIQQEVAFNEQCVKLYVCELALALDYLQSKRIVHRDIKPDNILLDEEGHAHITDFNIATVLEGGQLATSMSGTKPYMAPEIFACAADECIGYGFPVDWWSLGVVAYEMFYGARPFDIHSATSVSEVRALFAVGTIHPSSSRASPGFVDLIDRLLCATPGGRISSLEELKKVQCLRDINFDSVLGKAVKPPFTPPRDHLNCDPTFELEEMIVETKPLHKKKKRLAKQRSLREMQGSPSVDLDGSGDMSEHLPQFQVYNREQELIRREREEKEKQWEQELLQAMTASELTSASEVCSSRTKTHVISKESCNREDKAKKSSGTDAGSLKQQPECDYNPLKTSTDNFTVSNSIVTSSDRNLTTKSCRGQQKFNIFRSKKDSGQSFPVSSCVSEQPSTSSNASFRLFCDKDKFKQKILRMPKYTQSLEDSYCDSQRKNSGRKNKLISSKSLDNGNQLHQLASAVSPSSNKQISVIVNNGNQTEVFSNSSVKYQNINLGKSEPPSRNQSAECGEYGQYSSKPNVTTGS